LIIPLVLLSSLLVNLSLISKRNVLINQYLKGHSESHNRFFLLLIGCAAKVLAADGKIEEVEVQTIKNFFMMHFSFNKTSLLRVEETLNSELKRGKSIEALSSEINRFFAYDLKLALLDFLFRLAAADFIVKDSEQRVLKAFATAVGITETDYSFLYRRYCIGSAGSQSSVKPKNQHYRILGLSEGATQQEIKSAYRQLVKKFHPDTVAQLGEDVKKASENRMKEIQQAYEALKQ